MNHTYSIIQLAEQHLKNKSFKYSKIDTPKYKEDVIDGEKMSIWVVPFEYKIFEEEDGFVYIAANTKKVMFILTGHGRIY